MKKTKMKTLNGVNIAVGITGGIAVYKAAEVVSALKKLGADVHVVMTRSACEFVSPLTFGTLSQNKVITDMFEMPDYSHVEHISLAQAADLFLICPATANIIGKVASGIADDFLSTTIMAAKCPVIFVPAMNNNMYENPIVASNIQKLKTFGYRFMEPAEGLLACGTSGKGRLPEVRKIVETAEAAAFPNKDLSGKRVLVTAGPTVEPIDPVRYITNHSSGKMGYSIAKAAYLRGAEVTLISGPVSIEPYTGVNVVPIITAREMNDAVEHEFENCDYLIMAAAVADYRPAHVQNDKIKKGGELSIELEQNPDILMNVAKNKGHRVVAGFCMETRDLLESAANKLKKKNLDFIVANNLKTDGAGFGVDTNVVTVLDEKGAVGYDIMSKDEIAHVILDKCSQRE